MLTIISKLENVTTLNVMKKPLINRKHFKTLPLGTPDKTSHSEERAPLSSAVAVALVV